MVWLVKAKRKICWSVNMRAPYFDCDISCSLDLQIKTASFVRGQASGFWLGSGWFTTRPKPSSFFTLGESRVTRRLLFRSILSTERLKQATGWIKNQRKEDSSLQNRGDFLFYCVFQACRGKCASRATRQARALASCARSVGPGWSKHEVPTTSTIYM